MNTPTHDTWALTTGAGRAELARGSRGDIEELAEQLDGLGWNTAAAPAGRARDPKTTAQDDIGTLELQSAAVAYLIDEHGWDITVTRYTDRHNNIRTEPGTARNGSQLVDDVIDAYDTLPLTARLGIDTTLLDALEALRSRHRGALLAHDDPRRTH